MSQLNNTLTRVGLSPASSFAQPSSAPGRNFFPTPRIPSPLRQLPGITPGISPFSPLAFRENLRESFASIHQPYAPRSRHGPSTPYAFRHESSPLQGDSGNPRFGSFFSASGELPRLDPIVNLGVHHTISDPNHFLHCQSCTESRGIISSAAGYCNHLIGQTHAKSVNAPPPPERYDPVKLCTYQPKLNRFRAPKPEPVRLLLPGRKQPVSPGRTPSPEPPRRLKRSFSEHEKSEQDTIRSQQQALNDEPLRVPGAFPSESIPTPPPIRPRNHIYQGIPLQRRRLEASFGTRKKPGAPRLQREPRQIVAVTPARHVHLPHYQDTLQTQPHLQSQATVIQQPFQSDPAHCPGLLLGEGTVYQTRRHLPSPAQKPRVVRPPQRPPKLIKQTSFGMRLASQLWGTVSSVFSGTVHLVNCSYRRVFYGKDLRHIPVNSAGQIVDANEQRDQAPKRRRVDDNDEEDDHNVQNDESSAAADQLDDPMDVDGPSFMSSEQPSARDQQLPVESDSQATVEYDRATAKKDQATVGHNQPTTTEWEESSTEGAQLPTTHEKWATPEHEQKLVDEQLDLDYQHYAILGKVQQQCPAPSTSSRRPISRKTRDSMAKLPTSEQYAEEWAKLGPTDGLNGPPSPGISRFKQAFSQRDHRVRGAFGIRLEHLDSSERRMKKLRQRFRIKNGVPCDLPEGRTISEFFENEPCIPGLEDLRLQANPNKLRELDREREERNRREEEERLRQEHAQYDAQLATLGLRRPNATLITPLSDEWNDKVDHSTMAGQHAIKTVGPESLNFAPRDFARIIPAEQWLNDSCIQAALMQLAAYVNKVAGVVIKQHTPKCVALNSFFWSQILSSGVKGKERMLKRVWGLTPQNFFDVDSILIPINAEHHWTFVIIRPSRQEIAYVDSFHSTRRDRLEKIHQFIHAFIGDRYNEEDWKTVTFKTPHQTNSWDCGMFVITNATYLALGLDPSGYNQVDLPLQRRRIAASILNGGFTGDFDLSVL
ncbi:hypothetical protein BJ170DRAFT_46171 [Xylariales sp. AK1849]|nr:hypothetical protein BJ170DRAFT_46171 [Xylariales sp. AK1849]